jgi:arsenical pump membrane protein
MIPNFPTPTAHDAAIWLVAAAATSGVILRPWRIGEAVWALAGAVLLVAAGLVPWADALHAIGRGTDVYLVLAGMMLLAELARREGVFDFLAVLAVRHAAGSAARLFALVYAIGIVVTVFMSNDATAVVLTPAVCAVARRAGARPLPYLLACAFVANAASFVLPISNPANLVVFGEHLPALAPWLAQFALPSGAAIAGTYAVLRLSHRRDLATPIVSAFAPLGLSATGRIALGGIGAVALTLLVTSAHAQPLGAPTLGASLLVAVAVWSVKREAPWPALRGVAWTVLLLVAGLFVLVEGLVASGMVQALGRALHAAAAVSVEGAGWGAGILTALACNLVNNLPAGLIAGSVVRLAEVPLPIRSAVAIGIDLGPNLSVTGSLATILWLIAIRRAGEDVTAWQFLRVGALAMPVALALALAALFLQAGA